ncbi:MAG: S-adenosylmethionine:tRNA ribosyltransferase-isomerase [Puniceicoccales bacterium]|nr:S-adenosylmethionine:tRNA ribosyltransferase-isomerase [Puniceicoccales bacterium]
MDSALFDYELPGGCVAAVPAARREESRLLVVERRSGVVSHCVFRDLPGVLPAGAVLFRNNARVLRARLPGWRAGGGGRVECLLLRPEGAWEGAEWWCLLRPGRRVVEAGGFGLEGVYGARVVGVRGGEYCVRFCVPGGGSVLSVADRVGVLPLPPYIVRARGAGGDFTVLDGERYQTVYAERGRAVAVAAPTAGLHFSEGVLAELGARGVASHDLTLHVGLGTFQPMKGERVEEHVMHREWYEIPGATGAALASSGCRLAVGTTSLRAMEDFARKRAAGGGELRVRGDGVFVDEAGLFVYPPARFSGAELLLTNFHLPRSTLMCLVAAFLTPGSVEGVGWLKALYAEAVARGYRFYSYGDAMLVL